MYTDHIPGLSSVALARHRRWLVPDLVRDYLDATEAGPGPVWITGAMVADHFGIVSLGARQSISRWLLRSACQTPARGVRVRVLASRTYWARAGRRREFRVQRWR